MSLGTWLKSAEAEAVLLFHEVIPTSIKPFEDELIHVGNEIKAALVSPEGVAIETALAQLIPGNWEPGVQAAIERILNAVIPALTNMEANSGGTIIDLAASFVKYLQGLSPKMKNAGLLKLLSALFQEIDPSLSEVQSDTAAQLLYAKTVAA